MNLREFIEQKIAELEASGNKDATLEYFGNVPDINRKMIGVWKRTGNFPFEAAEAVFDNEFENEEEVPVGGTVIPEVEPETEDEVLTADGQSVVPSLPSRPAPRIIGPQPNQGRRRGERHPGISVGQPRGAVSRAPQVVPPAIDPGMVDQITQAVIRTLSGGQVAGMGTVAPQGGAIRRKQAPPARGVLGGNRGWNKPRKPPGQ